MLAARFIMFYAAGRANTEECFGLIEHGYYGWRRRRTRLEEQFMVEQTMPSSAPCYFLTRKSAGGESHQSSSRGNMRVKVGVEGAITISILGFFLRMKVPTAGSRMSCSPCPLRQLGAGAETPLGQRVLPPGRDLERQICSSC